MANEYSAKIAIDFEIVEVLDAALVPAAASRDKRKITHSGGVDSALNAATVPAVDKVAVFTHTLTGGTDTIDLTSLIHALSQAVDATGHTPFGAFLKAPNDNASPVNVAEGASNGCALLGAGFDVSLAPGSQIAALTTDVPVVSGTEKTIDVSGDAADTLEIMALFYNPA